jgi:hypothetical protein
MLASSALRELRTTEYNFRHQTKMKSIGVAELRMAKPEACTDLQFSAYFVGFMLSRPALELSWLA